MSVVLGGPGATFDAPVNYATGAGIAFDVGIADVNGDAIADLVTANGFDSLISVLLGNGDGTFGVAATFPTGSGAHSGVVGDFDRDGAQDVAVANETGDSVSVLAGNGTGSFGSPAPYPIGDRPVSVTSGDIDGDGLIDLVASAIEADEIWALLAQNDGTFGEASAHPVGNAPFGLALAELNEDGRLDVAVANELSDSVCVLLNETAPSEANLSIAKSDSPDPVIVGSTLTYNLAVTNAGPDEAADVTVTDVLPASVTFGSASASQ
ncbi:MAG: FG-GAP-like repeat-containing protein, partial [Vicinamibacterales bacterium]